MSFAPPWAAWCGLRLPKPERETDPSRPWQTFNKPRPMTLDEIADLIDRFAYAAKVLYDAGADGIQLHAAVSCVACSRMPKTHSLHSMDISFRNSYRPE